MHSSFVGTVPQPSSKNREAGTGPSGSDPQKQIFVKNCPKDWTHVDLYEKFSPFGEISSAKMSITANFESRCYGFVEFTAVDAAQQAVASMDGKTFEQDEEEEAATEAAPSGDGADSPEKAKTLVTLQVTNFESKRQRARQGQE